MSERIGFVHWHRVWEGKVSYICVCIVGLYSLCRWKSRYMYIVQDGYLSIIGAPSVQSCCTISISASYRIFACGRYRKSRLVCV